MSSLAELRAIQAARFANHEAKMQKARNDEVNLWAMKAKVRMGSLLFYSIRDTIGWLRKSSVQGHSKLRGDLGEGFNN